MGALRYERVAQTSSYMYVWMDDCVGSLEVAVGCCLLLMMSLFICCSHVVALFVVVSAAVSVAVALADVVIVPCSCICCSYWTRFSNLLLYTIHISKKQSQRKHIKSQCQGSSEH